MRLPDGAAVRVSAEGGFAPVWAPSGREISLPRTRRPDDGRAGAGVRDASAARSLFDASGYELRFAAAPDGKRLLMMPVIAGERASTTINLVFDFLDELRQRVR